MDSIAVKLY